jgi:formylmethanofuran dehydrogenase subunit E
MAFVEGGAFECSAEDFRTESVREWNEHCSKHDVHVENGETLCVSCGDKIYFEGLPYHPIDERSGSKNISLRCDECNGKFVEQLKITKPLNNNKEVKLTE